MFVCNKCKLRTRGRSEHLAHVGQCKGRHNWNSNPFMPLMNLNDDSEPDDSDKDPTWDPSETADQSSPSSSPLTKDHQRLAEEFDYLLRDDISEPMSSQSSNPLTNDNEKPADEFDCLINEETTKPKPMSRSAFNKAKRKLNFNPATGSNTDKSTLQLAPEKRRMSIKLQEKMENLQQSIAQFKMNRKKALSEGKKSQARRITNKIKKYNLLLEEHSTSNEEEVSNRIENSSPALQPPHGDSTPSSKIEKNQKRKKNYCLHCNRLVAKFAEHLERCHIETKEGKQLQASNRLLPTERRIAKMKITVPLIKQWNAKYNEELVQDPSKSAEPIPVKRRHGGKNIPGIICVHCKGLYRRDKLSVHLKVCSSYNSSQSEHTSALKQHSQPLIAHKFVSSAFHEEILKGINQDEVMECAMKDTYIMKFGSEFHHSRREASGKNYVIREIRDLAKLLLNMKKINPSICSLKDCFTPLNFVILTKAALGMAQYNEKTGEVGVPSIAYRLLQPIKDTIKIMRTDEVARFYEGGEQDRSGLTKLDDFLQLVTEKWSSSIGRICTKSMKKAKADRSEKMTLEEDIIKLAAYVEGSYRKLLSDLENKESKKITFNTITHTLVTHIMLLIRRRPVDFKNAKLQHYNNLDKHDELISMAAGSSGPLNTEDLEVCKKFHIFYVPGKNLEIVPMVLTPLMKKVMDTLLSYREHVGIKSDILFVLAEDKLINPNISLKTLVKKVQLKKPDHVTGNGLRHQAATFSKLHSTHPQYQDFLASALGHTLSVHKKHYDLPLGILQKIIVCPILHKRMIGERGEGQQLLPHIDPLEEEELSLMNDTEDEPPTIEDVHTADEGTQHKILYEDEDKEEENATNYLQVTMDEEYTTDHDELNSFGNDNTCSRRRWTEEEQEAVIVRFGKDILKHKVPHLSEVRDFLNENKSTFEGRSLYKVMLFVRNHSKRLQKNVTPKVKRILNRTK